MAIYITKRMTAFKNSVKSISHGLLLVSRNTSGFKNMYLVSSHQCEKNTLGFHKEVEPTRDFNGKSTLFPSNQRSVNKDVDFTEKF